MSVVYEIQFERKVDGQWCGWCPFDGYSDVEETDVKVAERRLEKARQFYCHWGEVRWRLVKRTSTEEVLFIRHRDDPDLNEDEMKGML